MNITIVGAGKSGVAAALLGAQQGNTVFVTESGAKERFPDAAAALESHDILHEFGGHTPLALRDSNLVIVSPGIPPHSAILQSAEERRIPIIGELEYAARFLNNPIIAVTGTNGKTTTTALTAHLLNNGGKKAHVAGNIGIPLSSYVGAIAADHVLVVETSSYQLDRIVDFRPKVAMILNVTPDHLSYHGSFDKYISAKCNIFKNQNENDLLILNADDSALAAKAPVGGPAIRWFGMSPLQQGAYLSGNALCVREFSQYKEETIMLLDELRLPGAHNAQNSMAALLAARAFEICNEDIRDSLMTFSGVEHRLEFVRTIEGVDFINDSKATNVNAAWYALGSYARPIVWIAGGRDDNNDYSALDEYARAGKIRCIVTIGEEKDKIFHHFCAMTRCIVAESLEHAVQTAAEHATDGDVVLFSPACKSFDMFNNYEHRGSMFKEAVTAL